MKVFICDEYILYITDKDQFSNLYESEVIIFGLYCISIRGRGLSKMLCF